MLLALVISHLIIQVAANPFHKYPFVFLLDVGNEELEKTNTEQIRVSIPGGSLALRYPAIGNGDLIGHVRVTGIDYGSNLKANIVDGGPGSRYVVLVFVGNLGVSYDTTVTIQTVKDIVTYGDQGPGNNVETYGDPQDSGMNVDSYGNQLNISNEDVNNSATSNIQSSEPQISTFNEAQNANLDNSYNDAQNEEDTNTSAEDMSDIPVDTSDSQRQTYVEKSNAELMQSSSNIYNYAQSEVNDDNYDDDKDSPGDELDNDEEADDDDINSQNYNSYEVSENVDEQKDMHVEYSEDNADNEGLGLQSADSDDENDDESEVKAERYSSSDDFNINDVRNDDGDIYSKYESLKPHLIDGATLQDDQQNYRPEFQPDPLDYEDPVQLEQVFDDGAVPDDVDKFKDANNNNYIYSDDIAVAY